MTRLRNLKGQKISFFLSLLAIVFLVFLGLGGSNSAFAAITITIWDRNHQTGSVSNSIESVNPFDVGVLENAFIGVGLDVYSSIPDPFGQTDGVILLIDDAPYTVGGVPNTSVPAGASHKIEISTSGTDSGNYSVLGGVKIVDSSGNPHGSGSYNEVIIGSGITIGSTSSNTGSVYGGLSVNAAWEPNVTGNIVTINGTIGQNVFGGAANGSGINVTNNEVIVNLGAEIKSLDASAGKVVGGSIAHVKKDRSFAPTTGTVSGNTVTVNGGDIRTVIGGLHEVGASDAIVKKNKVVISGGTIVHDVYGGLISQGEGTVTGNIVDISGGFIDGFVGGGKIGD
jgi:hypothetical protein